MIYGYGLVGEVEEEERKGMEHGKQCSLMKGGF